MSLLNRRNSIPLVLALLCIVFPIFVSNRYVLNTMVVVFTSAALGVAWNIIGGYGAQVSFGHAVFYAAGAYTSFLFYLDLHVSPFISIFLGMIVAVLLSLVVGYPSFRLRGVFFSLATIAFGEIVLLLLLHFSDFTGGPNGLVIPFKGSKPWELQFYSEVPYYYLSLVLIIMIMAVTWLLEKSRLGYFLRAVREDQDAAESLGIQAYKVKLIAFMISAAMTAAVGTITAFDVAFVDPNSSAGLDLSIKIVVIAIVGGVGTLWGPVLGAFILVPLTELLNGALGSTRGGASTALYGLILMAVIIFQPKGLLRLVERIWPAFTKRGAPRTDAGARKEH